jgi:hypothetical protein
VPLDWNPRTIPRAALASVTSKEQQMRVKITETREAAPDGITVVRLEKGEVYDLPEDFAQRAIEKGRAEPAADEPPAEDAPNADDSEEPAADEPPAEEKKPSRRRVSSQK